MAQATEVFIGTGGWQTILGEQQRQELRSRNLKHVFKFMMRRAGAHFFWR